MSGGVAAEAGGAADRRQDLHVMLAVSGALMLLSTVGIALQGAFFLDLFGPGITPVEIAGKMLINAFGAALMLAAMVATRLHRPHRLRDRVVRVLVGALVAAGLRVCLIAAVGVYAPPTFVPHLVEFVGAVPVASLDCALGMMAAAWQRRMRARALEVALRTDQARTALSALASEELRVRRDVAEGLHGTAQQRLVMAVRELDEVTSAPADEIGERWRTVVAKVRDDLDDVRSTDLREMSRLLYPPHLDLGLVPAVRGVVRLVPATTSTKLTVAPEVQALEDPARLTTSEAERLLAVRVVEEALTNAVHHGAATSIAVHLGREDGALLVEVTDRGRGFDVAAAPASGLSRLDDRLRVCGGSLEVSSTPGVGTTVRAHVPVGAIGPDLPRQPSGDTPSHGGHGGHGRPGARRRGILN